MEKNLFEVKHYGHLIYLKRNMTKTIPNFTSLPLTILPIKLMEIPFFQLLRHKILKLSLTNFLFSLQSYSISQSLTYLFKIHPEPHHLSPILLQSPHNWSTCFHVCRPTGYFPHGSQCDPIA